MELLSGDVDLMKKQTKKKQLLTLRKTPNCTYTYTNTPIRMLSINISALGT